MQMRLQAHIQLMKARWGVNGGFDGQPRKANKRNIQRDHHHCWLCFQVDLLYLHNVAEMQLGPLGKQGFRQVLGEGFRALEELRREGRIRAYGLATWDCFRLPPSSPSHLSLQDVVALARDIGGIDHGFRCCFHNSLLSQLRFHNSVLLVPAYLPRDLDGGRDPQADLLMVDLR